MIAAVRHGLREPLAGGLERHTSDLARCLRRRGHAVTVFASGDADADLQVEPICPTESLLDLSPVARQDVSMLSDRFMVEHDAYMRLMLSLPNRNFDVIHDNSLHYLPLAMAGTLRAPFVKVLHTPPTPWLESAMAHRADNVTVVSVSASNARQWRTSVDQIIPNGVDLEVFHPADGSRADVVGPALWSGRIVPEKGTVDALQAAHRAGIRLDIAGPVGDDRYFTEEVEPLLDGRRRWIGHLDRLQLAQRLRAASVAVITPRWEEPYGLVVAEALASGVPVAGYLRGALPQLLTADVGVLVPDGDIDQLALAIGSAARLDRRRCRQRAEEIASLDAMTARYESLYTQQRVAA